MSSRSILFVSFCELGLSLRFRHVGAAVSEIGRLCYSFCIWANWSLSPFIRRLTTSKLWLSSCGGGRSGQNELAPSVCSYNKSQGMWGTLYSKLAIFPLCCCGQCFEIALEQVHLLLTVFNIKVDLHSFLHNLADCFLYISGR